MKDYIKTNLHTHTLFCDGKATPEENVKKAIEKNIKVLGFSAHSLYPFSSDWHMSTRDFTQYAAEINRLKEAYRDSIEILLGFEADYLPPFSRPDIDLYKEFKPDFLIGSVHYLYNEKGQYTVDNTPAQLVECINTCFDGSVEQTVRAYFKAQRDMLNEGNFTVIGHCDLIRKFNDTLHLFTEEEDWYKEELVKTADAIKKSGVIAEVNTGAIGRGYMTEPYPSLAFLTLLRERNVSVMLNSDAHTPETLDCAFDHALEIIKKAGYTELAVPYSGKIDFCKL